MPRGNEQSHQRVRAKSNTFRPVSTEPLFPWRSPEHGSASVRLVQTQLPQVQHTAEVTGPAGIGFGRICHRFSRRRGGRSRSGGSSRSRSSRSGAAHCGHLWRPVGSSSGGGGQLGGPPPLPPAGDRSQTAGRQDRYVCTCSTRAAVTPATSERSILAVCRPPRRTVSMRSERIHRVRRSMARSRVLIFPIIAGGTAEEGI